MRRIKLTRALIRLMALLPKRYPIHSSEPLPQPFFIFGSGRNGSTMLNLMLNQHPDMFLPSEQYFLGNTIIKYQLYNWMIWRDLGKILAGELIPTLGSHWWEQDMTDVFSEIVLMDKKEISLEKIIYMIYFSYSKKMSRDFKIWGDSTNLNTYYFKEIYSIYPKSKFIILLRDARDVVASYKIGGKKDFVKLSEPFASANYWVDSVHCYDWLCRKKANVHLVKYEDLVIAPEQTLANLLQFLEVDYTPSILAFHKQIPSDAFYSPPQHQNLQNPINPDSIGKWKKHLDEKDLAIVMPIISKNLNRFGYL